MPLNVGKLSANVKFESKKGGILLRKCLSIKVSQLPDLNRRPMLYESIALPLS